MRIRIMTIHLPKDLKRGIRATVLSGAFASEDAAIAEAVRQFLRKQPPPAKTPMTEEELKKKRIDDSKYEDTQDST